MDLFGGEDSSNAANYFGSGLKGRFQEMNPKRFTEHSALEGCYELDWMENGQMGSHEIPMRRAMNLVLRDAYRDDCLKSLARWNKIMEKAGREERFYLPSQRFNRKIGVYANASYDPHGEMQDDKTYWSKHVEWLPTHEDLDYVKSVMVQVTEPGKFAGWIAPPAKGLNGQPVEFEYVKLGG